MFKNILRHDGLFKTINEGTSKGKILKGRPRVVIVVIVEEV